MQIYDLVISEAKSTNNKVFYYEILNKIIIDNIDDIVKSLQYLFQGCSVKQAIMSYGTDGKLYDISKLTDDDLQYVDTAHENSFIVIDWS